MNGTASSSNGRVERDLKALQQRADQILKARPAYQEMVDFYLTVFRRQIEWRDRLVVHPQAVDGEQRRQCLRRGQPLLELYHPGIDADSLLNLWAEMKAVFRRGNDALRRAVDQIDDAEKEQGFLPAPWLLEQRPDRLELVADAAGQIGVDQSVLATLARAVTLPHWKLVAQAWLASDGLEEWKRPRCPVCGGAPGLAETHTEKSDREGLSPAKHRFMHCPFCASRWVVPSLKCPACQSTSHGDAKFYYTPDEAELRIDFCKSCRHYLKVVDADGIVGRLHVGLELLTTAHLDTLAQGKNLRPLETCS